MTKEQAETSIKFLESIWSDCEFDNGALRYAVEALEMQIPKKPKKHKTLLLGNITSTHTIVRVANTVSR